MPLHVKCLHSLQDITVRHIACIGLIVAITKKYGPYTDNLTKDTYDVVHKDTTRIVHMPFGY